MGSLLSRARLLRERPLYPSEGLLRKARNLRGRTGETPPSGTASIDPLRRKEQEIMAEMDSILGQNRLTITDETLKFSALSSGTRFPLMLNLAAAATILIAGTGLFFLFNRGEASQVDPARRISSAESRIISAVREESRQELARKEAEINSINQQLRKAEEARVALIAETENELLRREAQLKEEMARELEAERQRLMAAGLNDAELNKRLSRYQEQQQEEYEEQLAAVNAELESRLEERSAELNQQMEEYRQALSSARSEQEKLVATREEAARAVEEAGADRGAALARLEDLNRQQRQKGLVEEHLLSMYDAVNMHLQQGEYQAASLQLDRLQEFINSPAAEDTLVQTNRMDVELFLIDSLRRLISLETRESTDPSPFEPLLASVSARIEEGNRLFNEGKMQAAGEAYTEALNTIPEIETGYARLQEIEERQLAQERSLLEEQLAEGNRLYREARYQASVDRYREALEILEREAPPLDQLLTQLMDAGYQLGSENEAQTEPIIITELIREEIPAEDRELIEKARAADERRIRLLDELESIRTRLAAGSSVQEAQASKEALISLLNTKLLIRQALASEEVRREYPDLYKNADAVFEVYGDEQRREERTETLRDMVAITDFLTTSPATELPTETAESARQRELLLQFLDNLRVLLGN